MWCRSYLIELAINEFWTTVHYPPLPPQQSACIDEALCIFQFRLKIVITGRKLYLELWFPFFVSRHTITPKEYLLVHIQISLALPEKY